MKTKLYFNNIEVNYSAQESTFQDSDNNKVFSTKFYNQANNNKLGEVYCILKEGHVELSFKMDKNELNGSTVVAIPFQDVDNIYSFLFEYAFELSIKEGKRGRLIVTNYSSDSVLQNLVKLGFSLTNDVFLHGNRNFFGDYIYPLLNNPAEGSRDQLMQNITSLMEEKLFFLVFGPFANWKTVYKNTSQELLLVVERLTPLLFSKNGETFDTDRFSNLSYCEKLLEFCLKFLQLPHSSAQTFEERVEALLLTEYKDSATGQFLLSEATINNYKLLFFETQYNNISDSSAAPAPNRVDTHVAYAA